MRDDSGIDVLMEFAGPTTLEAYIGLRGYLKAVFGRSADLVSEKGLKSRARPGVEENLFRVA
jgi:predicted nucleotidyltransferase